MDSVSESLNCTGIELCSTAPVDRELKRVRLAHSDSTLDCQTALFFCSATAFPWQPFIILAESSFVKARGEISCPVFGRSSDTREPARVPLDRAIPPARPGCPRFPAPLAGEPSIIAGQTRARKGTPASHQPPHHRHSNMQRGARSGPLACAV